jgi:segregation and condensation protein A
MTQLRVSYSFVINSCLFVYSMHSIKVQQFEGPLDLLLSLIEQQQLDITQISLAQVTEQFLQYIKQLEQVDPSSLADYLSIAAKLLVIKSKAILPTLQVEPEEEDAAIDLEAKLLLYKQFKEVAKYLKLLDNNRRQSFTRLLTFEEKINFYPDPDVTTKELHDNILKVLNSLKELDNLPKAKIKEAISIQEKIDHLRHSLSLQVETKLSDLLKTAKNKSEVIVTFLALLELIKQRIFIANQETLFSEVTIKKYADENPPTV